MVSNFLDLEISYVYWSIYKVHISIDSFMSHAINYSYFKLVLEVLSLSNLAYILF